METTTTLKSLLTQTLSGVLRQGFDLLNKIDDRLYNAAANNSSMNGGAIGGHFRHCIEFVNCFLNGIESGRIDYEKRERNLRIEIEREFAMAEILRISDALEISTLPENGNKLLVKPEDLTGNKDFWCESSIERELEFLQSHTIHHYALVAFKLRSLDITVPPDFGIATSTLRFWANETKNKQLKVRSKNV